MINGAWYAFGADGYTKSGFFFDHEQSSWFFIDINSGMKTGWQQIENNWYYFNPVSDGTMGKLYTSATTPDGYQVDENGRWISKETLDLKKRVLLQQKKAHAFSLRFCFRPIPITVIHQMEIHLHLCILSSPIPDGLKDPPVGRSVCSYSVS